MRVFLTNLGCKLNQAELERLARELHFAGHRVVSSLDEADLHVVNSCTVTHRAARDSRKVARRDRRLRRGMKTVLTGCYATGSPQEAAALAGVDLVVPNSEKERLVDLLHARFPEVVPPPRPLPAAASAGEGLEGSGDDAVPVPYVPLAFGNTRSLVKVEDGCNMRCSFCIIPSTRGRQRSRPIPEVVEEVRSMARRGVAEVVVTGVQISHYRWRGHGIADLTRALLDETDVPRIRLTSIAPWRFDRRLLRLLAHERVCRHVHLSLQSGADRTLRRMRRPYTGEAYRELVGSIRAAVPGVAVTTDVIVGFPGETEEEHRESVALVGRIGFARTHVFSYSPRAGTDAAALPDPIDPREVKRRTHEMIEAARPAERAFARERVGETVGVLFEGERDGVLTGTTDNYVRVVAEPAPGLAVGRLAPVAVVGLAPGGGGLGAAGVRGVSVEAAEAGQSRAVAAS